MVAYHLVFILILGFVINSSECKLLPYGGGTGLLGRISTLNPRQQLDIKNRAKEIVPAEQLHSNSHLSLKSSNAHESLGLGYSSDLATGELKGALALSMRTDAEKPSFFSKVVSSLRKRIPIGKGKSSNPVALKPGTASLKKDDANSHRPVLQRGFEHFQTLTEVLGRFIDKNKGSIALAGKAAAGIWIGVLLARRAYNWYSGMAEYELLIDRRDHQYAAQGAILHDIVARELSNLNSTALAELKYDNLYEKVALALEKPCYPQSMSIYAVQSGRTTAVLLSEIDNRIRVYRRKVSRYSGALPKGAVRGGAESAKPSVVKSGTVDVAGSVRSAEEEGRVLLALQRALTVLQARQSDAFLRLSRLQVLQAANTIEDLITIRARAPGKLSVPRGAGNVAGRSGSGTVKSKLKVPENERTAVLESLAKGYYEIAGHIQHHLDALHEVEVALLASSTSGSGDLTTTKRWAALEAWVSGAAALSTQSLSAISSGEVHGFVWSASVGDYSGAKGSASSVGGDSVGGDSSAYTVHPFDYSDAHVSTDTLTAGVGISRDWEEELAPGEPQNTSIGGNTSVYNTTSDAGVVGSTSVGGPLLLLTYDQLRVSAEGIAMGNTTYDNFTTNTTNNTTNITNATNTGNNTSESTPSKNTYYTLSPHTRQSLLVTSNTLHTTFALHRTQWRASGVILTQLQRVAHAFSDQLTCRGLMKRSHRGVLGFIRPNVLLKLAFWSGVAAGALGLTKRSSGLSFRAEAVARHVNSFVERRVVRPLTNILNDVVLNKRTSITDQAALQDAKRSLSVMLYDFLTQHGKQLSESERRRISQAMDMRPVSVEYELELRRPMQSLVSGKIARLVLIQLQFVKKELLVAMKAIDDLFNANQVNLQLLAITPAVLSIIALNIVYKTLLAAARATSQGRRVESSVGVQRELRQGVRALEMVLLMSPAYRTGANCVGVSSATDSGVFTAESSNDWSTTELGRALSVLYRLQNILVHHTDVFDAAVLAQIQEDLRDLTLPSITITRRLVIVNRLYRVLPSIQASRNIWNSALLE